MSSTTSNNNKSSLSPLRRQREDTSSQDHQHQHPHHVITQPVFLQKILPYAANHLNSVATFKSVSSSWHETQVHYSGAILCWKAFIESEPREMKNSHNTESRLAAKGTKSHDVQTLTALRYCYLSQIFHHYMYRHNVSSLQHWLAVSEMIIQTMTILEPPKQKQFWKSILYCTKRDIGVTRHTLFPFALFCTARAGQYSSFVILFDIATNFEVEKSALGSDSDDGRDSDGELWPPTLTNRGSNNNNNNTLPVNNSGANDEALESLEVEIYDKNIWLKSLLTLPYDAPSRTGNNNTLLMNACKADDAEKISRFILEKIEEIDKDDVRKKFLRKQLRVTDRVTGLNILQTVCLFSNFDGVKLIVNAILSLDDVAFIRDIFEKRVDTVKSLAYGDFSRNFAPAGATIEGSRALNIACTRDPVAHPSSKDTARIIQLLVDTALSKVDFNVNFATETYDVVTATCLGKQLLTPEAQYWHIPLLTAFFVGQHSDVVSAIISAIHVIHPDSGLGDLLDGCIPNEKMTYTLGYIDHEDEELSALVVAALFSPVCTLKLVLDEIEKEEGTSGLLARIDEETFSSAVSPFKCAKTKEKVQLFVDTFLRIGGETLLWQQLNRRSGSDGETVLMTICRVTDSVETVEYLLGVIQKLGGDRFLRKQFEMKTSRSGKSFLGSINEDYEAKKRKAVKEKMFKFLESKMESLSEGSNIRKYFFPYRFPRQSEWEFYERAEIVQQQENERLKQRILRRQREAEGRSSHHVMQDAFFLKKILPFASDLHYSAAIFKGVCTSWQHVQTRCDGAALCWKAFMEDKLFPENLQVAGSIVIRLFRNLYDWNRRDFYSPLGAFRGMVVKEIFDACCVDSSLSSSSSSSSSLLARKLLLGFRDCVIDKNRTYLSDNEQRASNNTLLMEVCELGDALAFKLLMDCADHVGGDSFVIEMFDQIRGNETLRRPLSMVSGLTLLEKIFARFSRIKDRDKTEFLARQLNHRSYCDQYKGWTVLMYVFGDLVDNSFQAISLKLRLGEEPGSNSFLRDIPRCGMVRLVFMKFIEIRQFEKCYRELNSFSPNHAPTILEACGFGKEFLEKLKEDGYSDALGQNEEDNTATFEDY